MNKTVRKPLGDKYVLNPMTLGDKLRNRRLEKGLFQKDLAFIISVTEDCITNWENNFFEPETRYYPAIIKFLGYIPFTQRATSFGEKIKYYRLLHGHTHKQMGKLLGVDGTTIGSWEKGEHTPRNEKIVVIKKKLDSLPTTASELHG